MSSLDYFKKKMSDFVGIPKSLLENSNGKMEFSMESERFNKKMSEIVSRQIDSLTFLSKHVYHLVRTSHIKMPRKIKKARMMYIKFGKTNTKSFRRYKNFIGRDYKKLKFDFGDIK